jgi:hypothetical protein
VKERRKAPNQKSKGKNQKSKMEQHAQGGIPWFGVIFDF